MKECKKPGFCNCMSSLIAKLRLRGVIKADREAAPCGRWVRVRSDDLLERVFWLNVASNARGWLRAKCLSKLKPRYRYEVRR